MIESFKLSTAQHSTKLPLSQNKLLRKLTAKAPENGWLEYDHFLLGWPIFRGLLLWNTNFLLGWPIFRGLLLWNTNFLLGWSIFRGLLLWNTNFLLGWPIFRWLFPVSFREFFSPENQWLEDYLLPFDMAPFSVGKSGRQIGKV